jgi:hypothetical protein
MYSVPNERKVTLSEPVVKNLSKADDSVEYTDKLAKGVRERVEYPTDGFDVTVKREVIDKDNRLLHHDVFSSHYARIVGVVLVGR